MDINHYRNIADAHYNNYGGDARWMAGSEELDPNDRTLTITATNADSANAQTARIFGSVKDLTDATLNANVTITVQESSHLQTKTELLTNSFRIQGLKYSVGSTGQFSNVLSLYEEHATGGLVKRIWQPLNYRSAQNQITTQIDAPSFELLVTSNTYIEFSLNASESVTFTFTLVEKTSQKNVLRGRSVRKVARVASPTGLPQIDLRNL